MPIVPVVEQPLHGTHGWMWGNKPHDSSCGVRFGATLPPAPLRSTSAATYRLFYSIRRTVHIEAMQTGRATLAVALGAKLPVFSIRKIKRYYGDTPNPAQGASAPYESLVMYTARSPLAPSY